MDIKELKTIRSPSVVLLGNFNPAIVHPEWFDRNQILPPSEVREIAEVRKNEVKDLDGLKLKFISSNVFVSSIETRLNLPSYRINVTPDRFEATTSRKEKFEELPKFVGATFKVLEHTPISSLGINFLSSLKFSETSVNLMHSLFCGKPETIYQLFGTDCLIDSRIKYVYKDSKVTLLFELKKENDEIGINFNYHKGFAEKEGTNEMIEYLLDNFESMMLNSDEVIKHLFGDPVNGGKTSEKPIDDSAN
jgi:hypothetical protein